jgi:hypothetical protein
LASTTQTPFAAIAMWSMLAHRRSAVGPAHGAVVQHLDVPADEFVKFRGDGPFALGSLCPGAGTSGLIGKGEDDSTELRVGGANLLLTSPGSLLVLPLGRGAGGVALPRQRSGGRRLGAGRLGRFLIVSGVRARQASNRARGGIPHRARADRQSGRARHARVRAAQRHNLHLGCFGHGRRHHEWCLGDA